MQEKKDIILIIYKTNIHANPNNYKDYKTNLSVISKAHSSCKSTF